MGFIFKNPQSVTINTCLKEPLANAKIFLHRSLPCMAGTKGKESAEKCVLIPKNSLQRPVTKTGIRAITQKVSVSLDKWAFF